MTQRPASNPPPEQVLLVDDNATNLQMLFHTLKGRDYKLLIANSGEQALSIAQKVHPALMLLDILMPEMDGFEVCERLKSDPQTRDVAVIFLSALTDTDDKVRGFRLGAVDFVSKPFQAGEVTARVDTHLKIHRLEQNLARRNRELELLRDQILRAMREGVFGVDAAGRVIFVNHAAAQMTGWSETELVGRILDETRNGDNPLPLLGPEVRKTLADARMRSGEQARFRSRDGSTFPVEYSIASTGAEGEISGAVVVFKDISERARAQAELKRTHEALLKSHQDLQEAQMRLIQAAKLESVGRLAAGVAHEVKNPLAVIQLGLDYLSNSLPKNAVTAGVLTDMADAVTRADTVIMGLLDFSREHRLELKEAGLNEVIRDSLQLVQHELTQHNIRLELDLDDAIPPLGLDPNRMQQVFINLFMNAVHAIEKDGVLRVESRLETLEPGNLDKHLESEGFQADKPVIRVNVEDTGCGIESGGEDKVFDPFFSSKPTGEGTGLGLSVTQNIIKLHRGSIRIRNREAGGAAVTILFKAAAGSR